MTRVGPKMRHCEMTALCRLPSLGTAKENYPLSRIKSVAVPICLISFEQNLDHLGLPPEFCLKFNCDLVTLNINPETFGLSTSAAKASTRRSRDRPLPPLDLELPLRWRWSNKLELELEQLLRVEGMIWPDWIPR